MKSNIKSVLKTMVFVFMTVMTTSCELAIQEKFEFDDEVSDDVTFGSTTAWQWIVGQSTTIVKPATAPDFTFMKEAIELTGLQGLYDDPSTKRTFFLLRNSAWTKAGGILAAEFPGALTLTDPQVNINKLRNLLLYHILDTYVDQGPVLLVVNTDYVFNSLYTGTFLNVVVVRRDRIKNMFLNQPSSAVFIPATTRKPASVSLHNYVFANGNSVGHILIDYIRNENFKSVP